MTVVLQECSFFTSFVSEYADKYVFSQFDDITQIQSDPNLCNKLIRHCKDLLAAGQIHGLLHFYLYLICDSNNAQNKKAFEKIVSDISYLNKPLVQILKLFEAYTNDLLNEDRSDIDIISDFVSDFIFGMPRSSVVNDEFIKDLYKKIYNVYIEAQSNCRDFTDLNSFFERTYISIEKKMNLLSIDSSLKATGVDCTQLTKYFENALNELQQLKAKPGNCDSFCNLLCVLIQVENEYGVAIKYKKYDSHSIYVDCMCLYSKYYLEPQIFALNSMLDCFVRHSSTESMHLSYIFSNYILDLFQKIRFCIHFNDAQALEYSAVKSSINILKEFLEWNSLFYADCRSRNCNDGYLCDSLLLKDHVSIFMAGRDFYENIGFDIYSFLNKYKNTVLMDKIQQECSEGLSCLILYGSVVLYNSGNIDQLTDLLLDYKGVFLPKDSFSTGLFRSEPYRYILIKSFYENSDYEKAIQLYDLILFGRNYDKIHKLDDKLFFDWAENSIQKHFSILVLSVADDVFESISASKDSYDGDEEKVICDIKIKYEPLKSVLSYSAKPSDFFDFEIKRTAESFLELISDDVTTYENLTKKLSVSDWNTMKQYIRQGNALFDFISYLDKNDWGTGKLDYSPALIEMTKSLEYFLNLVFDKIKRDNVCISKEKDSKYYVNNKKIKKNLEFGPCAYLFEDDRFNRLLCNIFEKNKLEKIWENLSIIKFGFCLNSQKKTELLFEALKHIKDLRNQAAHKNGVTFSDYKECKQYMLTTQYVLWILLYILNNNFGD